ncbi:methyltransferase domain-containing protein [Gordonia sp. NPDC003376]
MPVWDPARYLQYADARARPFLDLIAQVPTDPATIVDLGCGPGHLTRHLRARWPDAQILGIDSSAEMIDEALRANADPGANYDIADADDWTPFEPVDLILSNAMFQWVENQFEVIGRLLTHLNPGGTFAVQVPSNADSPTRTLLADLAAAEPYATHLRDVRRLSLIDPIEYLEFFSERGFTVNAWESTYLHVLVGDDPVYEWLSGTGARPFLQALPEDLAKQFADDLKTRLREVFPERPWGTTMPFRRTFAVATAFEN